MPPARIRHISDGEPNPDYATILPQASGRFTVPIPPLHLYTSWYSWANPLRARTASLLRYGMEQSEDPHVGAIAHYDRQEYEKVMQSGGHDTFVHLTDREMKIIYGIIVNKSEYEHLTWE
jgi:hypothetical protein